MDRTIRDSFMLFLSLSLGTLGEVNSLNKAKVGDRHTQTHTQTHRSAHEKDADSRITWKHYSHTDFLETTL